jgi:predicted phage baseplate assembly protein
MPIPLPKLDVHTFDDLVNEGRALLPRYMPGWTDHNVHDPGITLMELFAWLAEMDLYRLDRVPEPSIRAFLRLLGIEPKPPQVAETVLVANASQLGAPMTLPDRTQITTKGQAVIFQTTHRLYVSPAALIAILTGPEGALTDYTDRNDPSSKSFPPLGSNPGQNYALYLGFDRTLANTPELIHLHMWTGDLDQDRQAKEVLKAEADAIEAAVNRCPPERLPAPIDWRHHYSVRTVWEYYAGTDQWLPLAEVVDETRALTLSGAVRFKAPDATKHMAGGMTGGRHATRFFIRCRLVSGHFDCPSMIRYIQINAVHARHAVDHSQRLVLGRSTGRARQTYNLPDRPIVPGSTTVNVKINATVEQTWNESLTWDRVGPYAHAYVLDTEQGEIRFGNGRSGAVPPAGAELSITLQVGGGTAGNVAAQSLTRLAASGRTVKDFLQPFPAIGGAAAESLFDAKARAVAWLSQPHRAVTLKDFETLALSTPGVPVARVKALADYDPALPCVTAPGAVTVIVIPHCHDSRPVPGPDLLRAVARYLDRRRLLTTELHVIPPEYSTIAVRATLHAKTDASPAKLRDQAVSRLNEFFHPLRGGPDGNGWPMGRAVYRSEVLALLNGLSGVVYVDGVSLEVVEEDRSDSTACCEPCGGDTGKTRPSQCGNIEICSHGLVVPGNHKISVTIERTAQ